MNRIYFLLVKLNTRKNVHAQFISLVHILPISFIFVFDNICIDITIVFMYCTIRH